MLRETNDLHGSLWLAVVRVYVPESDEQELTNVSSKSLASSIPGTSKQLLRLV